MPGEAEIGHLRLDKTGVIVESRCSGWAIDARIRAAAQGFRPGRWPGVSARPRATKQNLSEPRLMPKTLTPE